MPRNNFGPAARFLLGERGPCPRTLRKFKSARHDDSVAAPLALAPIHQAPRTTAALRPPRTQEACRDKPAGRALWSVQLVRNRKCASASHARPGRECADVSFLFVVHQSPSYLNHAITSYATSTIAARTPPHRHRRLVVVTPSVCLLPRMPPAVQAHVPILMPLSPGRLPTCGAPGRDIHKQHHGRARAPSLPAMAQPSTTTHNTHTAKPACPGPARARHHSRPGGAIGTHNITPPSRASSPSTTTQHSTRAPSQAQAC